MPLDAVRIDGADQRGEVIGRRVGDDRDDLGPGSGRTGGADESRQDCGLGDLERPGRPGNEVQPDRVSPGTDRGERAVRIGHAADLHVRPAHDIGRVIRLAAGLNKGGGGCGRIGRAHERLADERTVEAMGTPTGNDLDSADAGLGDDQAIVRHEATQPIGQLGIDLEGAQIPVVDPDQSSIGRKGRVELLLVMGLDERLQAELQGARDEAGEPPGRMEDREEQHEIGTSRPQHRELDLVDDELLGQHRDPNGRPDRAQVVDRPAEPVRLAQHRDRRGTARGIGTRAPDDVVAPVGDLSGGWRGALDLGDEMETGTGQELGHGSRRCGPVSRLERVAHRQPRRRVGNVAAAALSDLADDPGPSGTAPGSGGRCDRHAGT